MNDAHPQMDVEPVIDAANAEPEPPNPVHDMLTICGIANAATCTTFINIEGLDSDFNNHADTTCAGPYWRLIELTGEYCTVSPFSAE
jgi:hypothetical protein